MHRRTLLKGAAVSLLAAPALGQDWRASTMRFVPQANLSSVDPIWTTATVTGNHGYYVYDTLFGLDMDFKPQPQMAEGYQVSDDGRKYRIRLREGLMFHDGVPVRAADCIASVKRWCQRDIMGQLLAKAADSWTVVDDRTFEIGLTRRFPVLIEALAKSDNACFIMPERFAVTDGNKQITEVVGSGPYKFLAGEYNSGSRAAYEKFDGYKSRTEPSSRNAGAKVVHFPRIEWHIIADPATASSALMRGEVDWWERPLVDLMPMLGRNRDIDRVVTDPTGRSSIMRLNHLQAPFNNVKVRRAVLMAIKQEEYMRASQGDDTSLWQVCRSLWGKGTPYYAGEQEDLMPQDLTKAQAALKESGYAGEKVVIINPTDFPDIGPLGQVTADLLKRLGMNVDLVETDWGTVVQRRSSREPVDKGGWSIFHTTGSTAGWGNPALSNIVRGPGAAGWFGWWDNPRSEALADEWLFAADEAGQKKAASALGRLALEEVATVPLGQFVLRTAIRKSITGLLPGSAPYPWGIKRV